MEKKRAAAAQRKVSAPKQTRRKARFVYTSDGRRIYLPTEPSVIGEKRIEEAVTRVLAARGALKK